MKRILIFLLPVMLTACYDSEEQEKGKKLKCDVFDYHDGIVIYSSQEVKDPILIVKYQKGSGFKDGLDTLKYSVYKTKHSNGKDGYGTHNNGRDMNTAYDYKIILNGTKEYKVTDITSKLYTPGGDFMSGTKYMCVIASYKLNDSLVVDDGNITIKF